ncbi:SARP family transcriptional regulator [Microtetraspora sp. NBRC 13810]|uniref:BTAD domain-containing putative transcriptional regulator n=1 Tax=Microtetraspora sp. NBRC 13810 TaxID=3030990 RepID=UPI0024A58849|nr:BTAD domain-containing putative transcriptional regulator [Microtetraspora sp. NBRC 13810]GLW13024.1 SARP family transcriptional regulator [Microtetraspora sp. NBRC 13810]
MRFGILGATEVLFDDGRPLALGGPRARSLLALLLLDAGRIVTAERLIDGLYGDEPPGGATNALQSHVSRLRQTLRPLAGAVVEFHPAGYRLAIEPQAVDAHRFERLAAEGRRALAAGDHGLAAGTLRDALALWRGPALADVRDAPFAAGQAARLAELRLAAVEDRVEAELGLGGHRPVAELRDLVAAHPLRERLRGQLMRALHAEGRQGEALAVFEDARRVLAEELGADPSPELARVHLAVLRAAPGPLTPAETAPPPAQPVRPAPPRQFTSFVGRAEELERLGKLLQETRLVTLTGPGGAGKSRLAIEAVTRTADEVCYVPLASLTEGREIPRAVLAALGLRESGLQPLGPEAAPADITDRVAAALAERRTLLVLDNCEHLVDDVARLADRLLGACAGLTVLATSREALGITGETLCPVPPLSLPPQGAELVQARACPSVQLFADRGAAVRPDFEVAEDTLDAVVRICRTLDGLPLAIELAAARLRSLPVTEVADRLADRFLLLSRGSRTAQPRHQTLRAVVAWSWDLLDEAEQTLARRLTVFAGGVTLEGAARVCGLPEGDVVELLSSLVDKSLVEAAGPRYRMLETIRAFCAERLAEAGEEERLRHDHAEHYLRLAEEASPYLCGGEQLAWLARLADEHDNLYAALRWTVHAGDAVAGLRLVAALSPYWWLRGQRSDAAPLAAALLTLIGPVPPAGRHEEYVLCMLTAYVTGAGGDDREARRRRVAEIFVGLALPLRHPFLLLLWATFMGLPKDDDLGDPDMRRLLENSGGPWVRAVYHLGMAFQMLYAHARAAAAEEEYLVALAAFRSCGERWGMATTLGELAKLADWRGDLDRALALSEEALMLIEQLGAREDTPEIICSRAQVLLRAGRLAEAEAEFGRAAELARRTALPNALARASRGLGDAARLRGDLAGARRLAEAGLALVPGLSFGMDEMEAELYITLGRIAAAEGDAGAARAMCLRGLAAAVRNPSFPVAAEAAEALAGVAVLAGRPERAAFLFGAGRALRGSVISPGPDVARESARARELLGGPAYDAACDRGAALTRAEALALLVDGPESEVR